MLAPVPSLAAGYLRQNAEVRGGAPAVIDPERTLSFAELEGEVGGAVAALARSVAPGSVVAVQLPNAWEYVALELAIPALGAVVMPLPLNLGEAEVGRALDRSGARHLVVEEAARSGMAAGLARERGVAVLTAKSLLEGSAVSLPELPPADPHRIVEIALTSGTTGLPKLAALSAGLKQATYEGFTGRLGVTPEDRVLVLSPLTQGIGGMCLLCLRRGAALVLLREPQFDPAQALRVAAAAGATLLVGVPTNVIRLLQSSKLAATYLSSARCTAVAGAPMPPSVAQEWEERTGSRVVSFYGSMDAGQLAVGSPDDPRDKRWHTVGRPHASCEVRICDPHDGGEVARGEVGEICMRGATVQERYWGEERGPLSADGWAHMGDLGRIDEDGFLHVVGRLKDILIRGGTNINPYELEDHLRTHPAVADVCVVGRPDAELGERVLAFVVGPVTLDGLRAHLGARGVARYKWPEFLQVLPEMPLLGPGKVNRRLLKEWGSAASDLP